MKNLDLLPERPICLCACVPAHQVPGRQEDPEARNWIAWVSKATCWGTCSEGICACMGIGQRGGVSTSSWSGAVTSQWLYLQVLGAGETSSWIDWVSKEGSILYISAYMHMFPLMDFPLDRPEKETRSGCSFCFYLCGRFLCTLVCVGSGVYICTLKPFLTAFS